MRLVVWNCASGLSGDRWHLLEGLTPDIAVIAGVETRIWLPADTEGARSTRWGGTNPAKGLGVFSFGEWILDAPPDESRVPWVVPTLVSGPANFFLLAIWTETRDGWPEPAIQVAEAVDAYRDELSSGNAVLAGDINGNLADAQRPDPTAHLGNVVVLRNLGLDAAFGPEAGVDHGFVFIPQAWKDKVHSVEVGELDGRILEDVDGHAPASVVIDF